MTRPYAADAGPCCDGLVGHWWDCPTRAEEPFPNMGRLFGPRDIRPLPPAEPVRCATRCSQHPNCQHDWAAWESRLLSPAKAGDDR